MNDNRKRQTMTGANRFERSLANIGIDSLTATKVDILQINMGKLCNQSCKHCHVNAGPNRTEIISRETLQECLKIAAGGDISKIDLTGGSPEMNPNFRWFLHECRELEMDISVRTNLTIMLEPGFEDIPGFLRDHQVEIIASLPCYTRENVDGQRGSGVFCDSLKTLKTLNDIGYGIDGSGLRLNLMYNPGGASLPGDQSALEGDYKRELLENHGIRFNSLYTLVNMPIGRFREYLKNNGGVEEYIRLLMESFNPQAASKVMCKNTISVGWDGTIYDCDFNQMLDLPCGFSSPSHISGYDPELVNRRRIVTGDHCFGCTAGAGSSCVGALDV